MRWVVLLFVVVPLAELYLLLQLARWIDFWPTVLLVLTTGILGGTLAKLEGLRVWRAWRHALSTMTVPEQGVLDGLLVLVGGVLLITPGILTDLTGLVLLFPFSRRRIAARLRSTIDRRLATGRVQVFTAPFGGAQPAPTRSTRPTSSPSPTRGEVIETTGEGVDD
jgi:UPF0716 protein FxsA